MAAEVAREDHDSVHDTSSLLGRSATANVDSAPLRPSDVIPQAAVVVKTTSVVAPPAATLLPASTQAAQPRPSDSASAVMGLILVIAASATFASMSLLVSLAARLGVPSLLSATFRFGAQAAFSVAWIARAKRGRLGVPETWLGKPANRRLLVQRGLIGAVSMCCLFYTVSTIPLAEATCIAFLNVPITAAVAACFLGERYTVVDGLAGAASAVGVVLVVQPSALFGGGASLPVLSLASGLLYSILSALVFVTIRAIGPGESALVLVLYFGVTGCVVAPVLLAALQEPTLGAPESLATVLGLEAGVGVLGFVGQVLVNRGMQLAPAGPSSAMRYSELLFALVFQVGVQGVPVGGLTLLGALLIMSGIGAVVWKAWGARRAEERPSPAAAGATATAITPGEAGAAAPRVGGGTPPHSEAQGASGQQSRATSGEEGGASASRSVDPQAGAPLEPPPASSPSAGRSPGAAAPAASAGASSDPPALLVAVWRGVRGFFESLSTST